MTLMKNAVRDGGSPPFVAHPQGSSCSPPSDPNYLRLKYYKEELQHMVENLKYPSDRIQAKYEAVLWLFERWE